MANDDTEIFIISSTNVMTVRFTSNSNNVHKKEGTATSDAVFGNEPRSGTGFLAFYQTILPPEIAFNKVTAY